MIPRRDVDVVGLLAEAVDHRATGRHKNKTVAIEAGPGLSTMQSTRPSSARTSSTSSQRCQVHQGRPHLAERSRFAAADATGSASASPTRHRHDAPNRNAPLPSLQPADAATTRNYAGPARPCITRHFCGCSRRRRRSGSNSEINSTGKLSSPSAPRITLKDTVTRPTPKRFAP